MADFNFFLNRQGVRGNKGEQGEQGYSPRITVKTETAAEYVLNVQNEDGSFDTPNLRGNAIENLGGTYVRFNQDTEQMYTGYADTASTTSKGEVVLSTYEDLTSGGNEDEVTTSKDVHDFVEAKISEASANYVDIGDYTQKMDELGGEISDLDDNKLDFTDLSNTLVAGTNITITPNAQTGEITIDSTGGSLAQVQADWNEADSSDPSYIKNKPTLGTMAAENASDYTKTSDFATVAFSGSYNDLLNTPSIPASQVQSDWTQSDTSAVDYIKNKPTIPSAANDATITITQGGVTKGSFTTNQGSDATIALDAGGGTSLSDGNGIDIDQTDKINIVQDESYVWSDLTVDYGTLSDGVLNGIATQSLSETVNKNVIGCVDFTTGSSILEGKAIFNVYSSTSVSFQISTVTSGDRIKILLYPNGTGNVSYTGYLPASTNTHYAVFFRMDKTAATAWMVDYTNKTTNTFDLSHTSGTHALMASLTGTLGVGGGNASSGAYFGGTVDTNKSYIIVDDTFISDVSVSAKYPAKSGSDHYGLIKPDNSTIRVSNGIINTDLTYLMTSPQITAINSGITSSDVSQITTNKNNIQTISTNYVTRTTNQEITGIKTFLGDKRIHFKQSGSTNKLGFTMYNNTNTEQAGLEYKPNSISGAGLLTLNSPQTTGNYVGFRYWGNPEINILASKPTTAGNYYLPINFKLGSSTTTAGNTGEVDLSNINVVASTSVSNIVSLTQSDYDTLVSQGAVDANTFYIITPSS